MESHDHVAVDVGHPMEAVIVLGSRGDTALAMYRLVTWEGGAACSCNVYMCSPYTGLSS